MSRLALDNRPDYMILISCEATVYQERSVNFLDAYLTATSKDWMYEVSRKQHCHASFLIILEEARF